MTPYEVMNPILIEPNAVPGLGERGEVACPHLSRLEEVINHRVESAGGADLRNFFEVYLTKYAYDHARALLLAPNLLYCIPYSILSLEKVA